MKFSIITPTYKRSDKLTRAVDSVLHQTHSDWEMIIVNDSPDDTSYYSFENDSRDSRIKYFKNENNRGVNYSRNFALDNVSPNSDFIIFLDDDDWFADEALTTFAKLINEHKDKKWFVTNRAYARGESTTKFPKSDVDYSYALEYLILKHGKGDATHCIAASAVSNIRFAKNIKQAEEWLFFYQVGLKNKIFYHNENCTLTDGYDGAAGLNFRKRTHIEQLQTLIDLTSEGARIHLLYHPTYLLYLFIRLVRLVFKY